MDDAYLTNWIHEHPESLYILMSISYLFLHTMANWDAPRGGICV